ncbi:MAG: hypothetical protein LW600_09610 [Ilumatobacteraceae bacterium]|jgi:predicted  nucleic acid-binding Zn-ribbon protein|nr:hypothetical protein [Ilumatobacteraceae bacterium]
MDLSAIEKIESWAGKRPSPRATFARQLAQMLRDEKKRPTLSLLDIRREFQARSDSSLPPLLNRIFSIFRALLGGLYLAPVAYTWYELRDVLSSFANDSNIRDGVSLIAYWTGQEGSYSGHTLQSVGLLIALFVGGLLLMQIVLDLITDDTELEDIPQDLNDALFAIQFDLAQTRVLTPQEFTKTISAAARELESALTTITATVHEASNMIQQVSKTTDGLMVASTTMGDVGSRLSTAIEPIVNLESSLRNADQAIQRSTQSMKEMQVLMANANNHLGTAEKDASRIGQTAVNIANAAEQLISQVESANKVVINTARQFSEAVNSSATIAQRLSEVLDVIDDRGAQLLTVREIAQDISSATIEIGRSVAEMKQASERFVAVNRDIAAVLKDNGIGN